jgi:hypothetical protein
VTNCNASTIEFLGVVLTVIVPAADRSTPFETLFITIETVFVLDIDVLPTILPSVSTDKPSCNPVEVTAEIELIGTTTGEEFPAS